MHESAGPLNIGLSVRFSRCNNVSRDQMFALHIFSRAERVLMYSIFLPATRSTTMTKRKSEEEKATVTAKRRVPFTMPKDVATKAMYEATSTHPNLAVADAYLRNTVLCETHQARRCYEFRLRFATRYGDQCLEIGSYILTQHAFARRKGKGCAASMSCVDMIALNTR